MGLQLPLQPKDNKVLGPMILIINKDTTIIASTMSSHLKMAVNHHTKVGNNMLLDLHWVGRITTMNAGKTLVDLAKVGQDNA